MNGEQAFRFNSIITTYFTFIIHVQSSFLSLAQSGVLTSLLMKH